jgi:hypothetical protein
MVLHDGQALIGKHMRSSKPLKRIALIIAGLILSFSLTSSSKLDMPIKQYSNSMPADIDPYFTLDEIPELTHTHSWAYSNCTEPKTCATCGETEGIPRGHIWIEANFQQPMACSECGETEGNPNMPGFEEYEYEINMTPGASYPYKTVTQTDASLTTIGKAEFTDFRIIAFDEVHEAKEGYEYQIATMQISYDDANAWQYGALTRAMQIDYYGFDANKPLTNLDVMAESEIAEPLIYENAVNYFGEDRTYYISVEIIQDGWAERTYSLIIEITFLAPIGYDGYMWVLYNGGNNIDGVPQRAIDNIDGDSLIIRFRGGS